MTEISRAAENAAARADEREALSSIFDGISLMNDERVEAPLDLDAGADDYLVKPFVLAELSQSAALSSVRNSSIAAASSRPPLLLRLLPMLKLLEPAPLHVGGLGRRHRGRWWQRWQRRSRRKGGEGGGCNMLIRQCH